MIFKDEKNSEGETQTDQESPETIPTAFPFNPSQNKSISMTKTSDNYPNLYQPIMRHVSMISESEVKQKLNSSDIEYSDSQIHNQFQKSCIKTDWQSIIYEITYGRFRTNLRVIRVNFAQFVICRNFYNKGAFGEIWKFDDYFEKKQYVLKNILIKDSHCDSIDIGLREVFMAKLFSALEIGPKISKIFQYDAILFEKSIQYAMEFCSTNYTKIQLQKQLKQKQLLKNLKIIHTLNICHKDIKYMNIAWSPNYNKFIFLDYNFTEIVKEPLGYKTLTKFMGTYNYSSPDMAKCYNLKQRLFVDLYYNDLYCLQGTWKEMNDQKQNRKKYPKFEQFLQNQSKLSQFIHVKKQKHLTNEMRLKIIVNDSLVKYFQLKMSVFNNDVQNIKKLIENDKVLFECFKKVIYNYSIEGSADNEINQQKKQLYLLCCHKLERKPKEIPQVLEELDSVLTAGEIKDVNKIKKITLFNRIIQISDSDQLFNSCWSCQASKEDIFFFVDVYSNSSERNMKYRRKLIDKIYKTIKKQKQVQKISETLKYRQVLLYYFEYFQEKNNIEVLQKILAYFVLMDDEFNCDRMQDVILKKLQAQKKWCEYLNMNFMMFLGQSILTNKNYMINTMKFTNNLSDLLKKSGQIPQLDQNLQQFFQSTVTLMRDLKNVRFYYCKSYNSCKFNQNLKNYLFNTQEYLNKDIKIVIEKVLLDRYFEDFSKVGNIEQAEYLKMQHILLEKYIFKMKVQRMKKALTSKNIILLLKSQQFAKEFPLFLHNSVFAQIPKMKRKQILADYCILGKNQKSFCNLSYRQAKLESYANYEMQKSFLSELNQLKIDMIKNIEDFMDFQIGLIAIMSRITFIQTQLRYKFSEEIKNQIYQKFSLFHELSTYISLHQTCYFCGDPILKSPQFQTEQNCQTMFQNHRKYLLLLFFEFTMRTDKCLDILLPILAQKQKNLSKQFLLIFFVCKINADFSSQVKSKLDETIMKIAENHLYPSFELLFVVEPLFEKIMMIYSERVLYQKAVKITLQFCTKMHSRKLPIIVSGFLLGIHSFVKKMRCPNQLKQIVSQQVLNCLESFQTYPVFTYFLGSLYMQLLHNEIEISINLHRRLIIVCVFFITSFHQGIFRDYKNKLFKLAKNLWPLSLKKQALNERRFGSSKKFLTLLEKKVNNTFQKRGNAHKQKYSKLLDQARLKINAFEQNKNFRKN